MHMETFIVWTIWGAHASAIIAIDHWFLVRRARARGEVDFSNGAPLRYMVLCLIASFLVLPVYFYATRKRWWALGLGVLASIGSVIATGATLVALGAVVRLFLA
jgi:hypothetical protein